MNKRLKIVVLVFIFLLVSLPTSLAADYFRQGWAQAVGEDIWYQAVADSPDFVLGEGCGFVSYPGVFVPSIGIQKWIEETAFGQGKFMRFQTLGGYTFGVAGKMQVYVFPWQYDQVEKVCPPY